MSEKPTPRPPGRPSLFTEDLASEIVQRLSKGEPLTVICCDDHMPSDTTVRTWARGDEVFSSAIARARDTGFDVIAWRSRLTLRGKTEEEGGESTGDVQRDKAIADHDLKLLAKWNPKGYGDRLAHVGGGPDDPAIRHEFSSLSDAELEARIRAKLGGPAPETADEPAADA
jgi:hypothetical protein